jgi:hypothetical protein
MKCFSKPILSVLGCLALASVGGLTLVGCDDGAENAGEAIDEAADDVEDAVDDATD